MVVGVSKPVSIAVSHTPSAKASGVDTVQGNPPEAFVVGNWSTAAGAGAAQIAITISALPASPDFPITAVQYSLNGGAFNSLLGYAGPGTYTIDVPLGGTSYDIQLRARNSGGPGASSDTKSQLSSAATAPESFTDFDWFVETGGTGELDVSITLLPDDNGAAITDIEYDLDGSNTWVSSGGVSDFSIAGLSNATSYAVRLRAVNSVGAGAAGNSESATSGAAVATAPDAFVDANWSVASAGETQLAVTIAGLPGNGGSAITDVEYRVNGGSWTSSGGTTSFNITGLTQNTVYNVELRAVNAVGAGVAGNTESATTDAAATAPSAFANGDWTLSTGSGAGELDINITSLPDDGGSALTAIEYTVDGGTNWAALSGTGTGARTVTLTADTSYTMALRAVNAVGSSAASPTRTATSGAASAVDPAAIAGALGGAYYDISQENTVKVERGVTDVNSGTNAVAGDPVGTIIDLSGNGFHLNAPSDAERAPLGVVGPNRFIKGDQTGNYYVPATTLDLGDVWSHIGLWSARSGNLFGTTDTAGGRFGFDPTNNFVTGTAATALTARSEYYLKPTVLTIEQSGQTTVSARTEGETELENVTIQFVGGGATRGLAVLTGINTSAGSTGLIGDWYGGFWAPAALTALQRDDIEAAMIALKPTFSDRPTGFDVLYDPRDRTAHFSELNGATLAAPSDAIALHLDMSQFGAFSFEDWVSARQLDSNLVSNGYNIVGTTGWQSTRSNSTLSNVGGRLRCTASGSGGYAMAQLVAGLTVDEWYMVEADCFVGTDNEIFFRSADVSSPTLNPSVTNIETTSDGRFRALFRATSTSMYVGIVGVATAAGQYFEMDNISFVALGDQHQQVAGAAGPHIVEDAVGDERFYYRYSGTDSEASTPHASAQITKTGAIVAAIRKGTTVGGVFGLHSNAETGKIAFDGSDYVMRNASDTADVAISSGENLDANHVFTMEFQSDQTVDTRFNGAAELSNVSVFDIEDAPFYGLGLGNTRRDAAGTYGGLLLYGLAAKLSGGITTAERAAAEQWCADVAGVTLP